MHLITVVEDNVFTYRISINIKRILYMYFILCITEYLEINIL